MSGGGVVARSAPAPVRWHRAVARGGGVKRSAMAEATKNPLARLPLGSGELSLMTTRSYRVENGS